MSAICSENNLQQSSSPESKYVVASLSEIYSARSSAALKIHNLNTVIQTISGICSEENLKQSNNPQLKYCNAKPISDLLQKISRSPIIQGLNTIIASHIDDLRKDLKQSYSLKLKYVMPSLSKI